LPADFHQQTFDADAADDCRQLVRLAVREDLGRQHDWTTVALVPEDAAGRARVVARRAGTIAGLAAVETVLAEMDCRLAWSPAARDGDAVPPGAILGELSGNVRHLLTAERVVLNILGRLSGIATLTSEYVRAIAGTGARLYDTRKTTPGWRRLEKYAVRCGGGHNHRGGLYEAVLIKDNHLAHWAEQQPAERRSPGEAVRAARAFLARQLGAAAENMIVEIEIDSVGELAEVLAARPDIVLLDNMAADQLRRAVALRDQLAPSIELEASGGVSLATIRGIAETGVDRISCGALTHSAASLDVALDWAS
jgi:nicotinate-nucleotide pyrophosphorylase (carboxylating)